MAEAQPQVSRVVRVAVIVDDRVQDEIYPSRPGSITVGTSYRSDVLVFAAGLPAVHRVFAFERGGYVLDLPPGVTGTISLGGTAATVASLRRRLAPGQSLRLRLRPKSRGKLRFGESTLLFQLTTPAPAPAVEPFPREYAPTWEQFLSPRDATSLLSVALVLGTLFVYAASLEVPADFAPEIDDRFVRVMGLREDKPEPEAEPEEEEVLALEEDAKKQPETEKEPVPRERPKAISEAAQAKARGVGLARVLGTYGGPGEGTVLDILQQTENNLGELFAAGMTQTVLADGSAISAFVPGGEGVSAFGAVVESEGLRTDEGPELQDRAGKVEREVKGRVTAANAEVFGDVDGQAIQATLRQRMSGLRHCHERALRSRPGLAGKMSIVITIGLMGRVTRVVIEDDTMGDPGLRACVETKIKGWRFPMEGAKEPAEVPVRVVFSDESG